jgi:hypothetical protein
MTAIETHKISYDFVGVAWTKAVCSCGNVSESYERGKRGTMGLFAWITKHKREVEESGGFADTRVVEGKESRF